MLKINDKIIYGSYAYLCASFNNQLEVMKYLEKEYN